MTSLESYSFEAQKKCTGTLLNEVDAQTAEECPQHCDNKPECSYFTFDGTNNKCKYYNECTPVGGTESLYNKLSEYELKIKQLTARSDSAATASTAATNSLDTALGSLTEITGKLTLRAASINKLLTDAQARGDTSLADEITRVQGLQEQLKQDVIDAEKLADDRQILLDRQIELTANKTLEIGEKNAQMDELAALLDTNLDSIDTLNTKIVEADTSISTQVLELEAAEKSLGESETGLAGVLGFLQEQYDAVTSFLTGSTA